MKKYSTLKKLTSKALATTCDSARKITKSLETAKDEIDTFFILNPLVYSVPLLVGGIALVFGSGSLFMASYENAYIWSNACVASGIAGSVAMAAGGVVATLKGAFDTAEEVIDYL